jgi:hypothetical protein
MNEELAHELVELQREQNALLKKHLWRLRFSLWTLLVLTTASAVCLGIIMVRIRSQAPASGVITLSAPAITMSGGAGTLMLQPGQPTSPSAPTKTTSDNPFE